MELKQLQYIIAIAEEKSLSRAAERLFVSKSALSLQISRLEKEEGLPPLFCRTKDGLTLTDAGRIYVNGARTILYFNEKADQAVMALTNQRHCLKIAVAPVAEQLFLTSVLPEFYRSYPNVRLKIQFTNSNVAKEALLQNSLDMALIIDPQEEFSLFHSRRLSEDEVVWAAAKHFDENPYSSPLILPPENTYWRATCDSLVSQEGIQGDILCETANHSCVCSLLRQLPVTAPMLHSLFAREKGLKCFPLICRYPYYISVIRPACRPVPPELSVLEQIIADRF